MKKFSAPMALLLGLLATTPAHAINNCNAVGLDDGVSFVGCDNGTLIGPQLCQGAVANCKVANNLMCDVTSYTSNPAPYFYCPNFPPNGDAMPVVGPPPSPVVTSTAEEEKRKLEAETIARQKAFEEELAKKAAAEISSQTSALQTADDISATGMNQAATIGAIWCAHGANSQAESREIAEQSYGTCKQYMGAADSIREQRGRNEAFTPDPAALSGDWAGASLDSFEKKFGVERTEFVNRLLSSPDRGAELALMTQSKLKPEELADAYANGKAPDAEKFAVTIAAKEVKKENLRGSLRKAIVAEAKRGPASEPKARPKVEAGIRDLVPLENPFPAPESTAELTIFQVIHRKYQELASRL